MWAETETSGSRSIRSCRSKLGWSSYEILVLRSRKPWPCCACVMQRKLLPFRRFDIETLPWLFRCYQQFSRSGIMILLRLWLYYLSYDVTRRSGLRGPLATQPTARASTRPCCRCHVTILITCFITEVLHSILIYCSPNPWWSACDIILKYLSFTIVEA